MAYAGALLFGGLLGLAFAAFSFTRLHVPGATPFLFGSLANACYALGSLAEIQAQTTGEVLNALTVEYLGIATIGPLLYLTAISSVQGSGTVSRLRVALLMILPALIVVLVATNDVHHLIYTSVILEKNGPFTVPVLGKGPFYLLNLIYMNCCILLALLSTSRAALRAPRAHRTPLLLLLGGSLIPWAGMAVYQLGLSPYGLDIAPFGLALTGVVLSVALFRFRLFDVTPLVLDQVFENMLEAVLIEDVKHRVAGFNRSFSTIFPAMTTRQVGQALTELSGEIPLLADLSTLKVGGQVYQVDQSVLRNKQGQPDGTIWMLTNITEREMLAEKLTLLARTDELTKLPNRRAFLERLKSEADRRGRYGGTLAVALIDLDFFKKVNDSWGHDVGDAMLQHVAELWTGCLRSSDVLARYGGEEFTVLMTETDADAADGVLQRMRSQLEATPLVHHGQPIPQTASFGVVTVQGTSTGDPGDWLRRADLALYEAKEKGRNRVVHEKPQT